MTFTTATRPGLLTRSNPKTAKGAAQGYLTAILHLAPHTLAGPKSVCPHATDGCIGGCLNTAGRGGIFKRGAATNPIQECRKARTRWFFEDRPGFLERLEREIGAHVAQAESAGLRPAVRLNGTSDLAWEKIAPGLFSRWDWVQFYDYTKSAQRARAYGASKLPPNYHLTYSRNEKSTRAGIRRMLAAGVNVAVVYLEVPVGSDGGLPVIDGDRTDRRFTDPRGVIVGLRAKGPARRDRSGFVLPNGGAL